MLTSIFPRLACTDLFTFKTQKISHQKALSDGFYFVRIHTSYPAKVL